MTRAATEPEGAGTLRVATIWLWVCNRVSYSRAPCQIRSMEDDPDYRNLHNTMLLVIVAPIMAYGIIRLLFHLLAG